MTGLALDALNKGDAKAAARLLKRHIADRPDDPDACNLLGMLRLDLADVATIPMEIRRSLSLVPNDAAFLHNLGLAALRLGNLTAASEALRQAVTLVPDFADAHLDLGTLAARFSDYPTALRFYGRTVALRPEHITGRQNRGWARLALGDFDRGFADYAWRWRMPAFSALTSGLAGTPWDGQQFGGTLLLIAEQGFGDTLQFCRLARPAAERARRVVLEVQPELHSLVARSLPGIEVVGRRADFPAASSRPAHDRHAALLDLPALLGLSVASIPGETPYLVPDPAKVAKWSARLNALTPAKRRIGLAWAGNPRSEDRTAAETDRRRSLPLSSFAPLAAIDGVAFVSLQVGRAGAEIATSSLPIHDVSAHLTDFDETAALIANLDLVLTVDTAVAHLAGALNRPVWVLSRADHCWRWLTERDDSPWYPTLRLFRQRRPGVWSDVVDSIRSALSQDRRLSA